MAMSARMFGRSVRVRVPMAQQEEERMTKRRTGIWSVSALLAIASLLIGACSQAPAGQTTTTTGGATGAADPNATLTLNLASEPDTIDTPKSPFLNHIAQASIVVAGLGSLH